MQIRGLRKLVLFAALGVSTLGVAVHNVLPVKAGENAGRKAGHGKHRKDRMARMARELNLTETQKSRLKTIMQESRERARRIKNDTSLSDAQKKAKMRENRAAAKKRVEAVLTAEQKRKLAAMRAEHRKNFKQQKGARKPA